MKIHSRTLLVATFLLVATLTVPGAALAQDDAPQCSFPYEATDATGTNVTIESVPGSVVALQPSDAQTMWDVGARDQVVAMPQTQYTAYLNDTGDRANVKNDDGSVNVEVVTNTSADLVLAANATRVETVRKLRRAGLTVYHFDRATSIADVVDQVSTIGRLTGNCDGADETVASMEATVEEVEAAVEGRDRPRVLYYFFQFTAGNGTHIHDLITTAGGSNVAAEAGITGYGQVSAEIVTAANPQWIVYPSDAAIPTAEPYNGTAAVQRNQTLSVNSNYVSQPGPRIVRPLRSMADAFHPDAFSVENETAAETVFEQGTASGTDTPAVTDDATPTAANGPGFGVLGAVLALITVSLAASWRR